MAADIPKSINRETLARIPDEDLWYVLGRYVMACLDQVDRNREDSLAALPWGLRMIHHLNVIEFEVPNGGFSQFLHNVEGKWVAETLEALKLIGAKRRADALERAIALFEREVGRPRDDPNRWQGPWFDSAELDEIDDQYPLNRHPLVLEGLAPHERTWYEQRSATEELAGFDHYVREHPDEFLHP